MRRMQTLLILLAWMPSLFGHAQSTAEPQSAKIWVGRHHEIEEYLKTAECTSMRRSGSNIVARCTLRPGGPIAMMAWKSQPPGFYRGFWESYKGEIAAYELDKLLKMDMVPPTVERQLDGSNGAAQQWVEDVVDATDPALPTGENRARWEAQLVRMTMFDNLIGNRARNRRNMLRDPAWNLILIDHLQAFGVEPELPHKSSGVDERFWAQIDRLTQRQLDAALRAWLNQPEIDAILARRERMRADLRSRPK